MTIGTGTVTVTFVAGQSGGDEPIPALAKLTKDQVTYNGAEQLPAVTVTATVGGAPVTLTEGTHYRLEYFDNSGQKVAAPKDAGEYGIAVIGLDPDYDCGVILMFTIAKASQTITGPKASYTKVFGNAAFALEAKASGGGALTYKSSKTGVAAVSTAGKVSIKGAGNAKITVSAAATKNYNAATKTITVTVGKANNPMTVKGKTAIVKRAKVKKKNQTLKVAKVLKISRKQGALTFKKVKGSKKITIAKKTGKVKVLKGTKKGTYKITVKVKAAGNSNYKALTKKVTFKVKVK